MRQPRRDVGADLRGGWHLMVITKTMIKQGAGTWQPALSSTENK